MGKKKKIIIVLGVITAIITIAGMGGVLLTKIKQKNENSQKIEKLLEREKNGKLKNGNMYEATDAMEALDAMIQAGMYSDAERIAKKYLKIYPQGYAMNTYLEDALKGEKKWDESAKVSISFARNNWKMVNITTTQYMFYTRMNEIIDKLSPDMKKEAEKFMKEIEDNEKLYKKLEKDRKNKKLKKDKSEIEKLLKKGASNEDFFVIYMEYLIETKQKDKAKKYLDAYKNRDGSISYIVGKDDIKRFEKELGE
ncbi:MAG: hypothetical protein ACLS49_04165 [Christensenellales bacterium]